PPRLLRLFPYTTLFRSAQVGEAIWFRRGAEELVALPGFTRCGMIIRVLLRLAYLSVTNVFALLRLLPVSDQDKDAEILALRHQRSEEHTSELQSHLKLG